MIDVATPDLAVIEEPRVAAAVLDPIRAKVLAELREPGSATTVAAALGETRQKVNYHLRALEGLGLVRLVEDRQRRGLTERVMVASARSYVLSPGVLGASAADPADVDQLSTGYVLALASRVLREVAALARRARTANKPLATLALDTDIRFASVADRSAFTRELAASITEIAGRYHDEGAADGRWHRVVTIAHQRPSTD